jgi:uncharacterized protein (TIGR00730 family)
MRRIGVYCASSNHVADTYKKAAAEVGRVLAHRGIGIVYGGGNVGLMGELATAALAVGGEVIGVIPEMLRDLELGHPGVTEMHVVDTMHARKLKMAELSDGFIGLPGGFGTLEEVFEVTTWSQLNYHIKPVGLLNVDGYFDHLLKFLDHASSEKFIRSTHRPLIQSADDLQTLLTAMQNLEIPRLGQWIDDP